MATPGRILETLREARQWSQEELAAKAGLSGMTISRIERGVTAPLQRTWAKLAAALDTTVVHLLTGLYANDDPHDPLTDRLLTLWQALPADQRPAGIEALEYLVKWSAEVQQLRAQVAARERQERSDAARLRDAERRVRALERAEIRARRAAARSATSVKTDQAAEHPTRQTG